MGILQCSLLEAVRKPARYLVLFLLFTIIFTGVLLGLNVYCSADLAKNSALDRIGGYIMYEAKDAGENGGFGRQRISEDAKKKLAPIEHVKGLNQHLAEYAFPVGFENVKEHTGEKPDPDPALYEDVSDDLRPNSIILDANTDCALIDDFRRGNSTLVEGDFPSDKHPGIMIEEKMSLQNDLAVGDSVALASYGGNSVKASITGIYRTAGSFEITKDNSVGEAVFAMSPYNRCYASLDVGASLYKTVVESLPLCIYIDQPQNVEVVGNAIKSLDLNWADYDLINMTASDYSVEGAQIESVSNYARAILLYVIVIGAILISLILAVYVRYYVHDAGVLIALGARKRRVMLQFAVTVTAVVICAFAASAIISGFTASGIANALIDQVATVEGVRIASYQSGLNDIDYGVHFQALRLTDYGYFVGVTTLFLVFSCGLLAAEIIRYRPRAILANKRG
jgi:putative ABC transport system permease protein